MASKTKRVHYSQEEKTTLISLVEKYKAIVENKITNAVSNKQKDDAWRSICTNFNARGSVKRDVDSLRKQWSNIKQDVRKKAAKERHEIYKTGGGHNEFQNMDPTANLALGVIKDTSVYGLENTFDCDTINEAYVQNEIAVECYKTDTVLAVATSPTPAVQEETVMDVLPEATLTAEANSSAIEPPTPTRQSQETESAQKLDWTARRRPKLSHVNPTDAAKIDVLREQGHSEIRRREREDILFELKMEKLKMDINKQAALDVLEINHKKKIMKLEVEIKEAELKLLLEEKRHQK